MSTISKEQRTISNEGLVDDREETVDSGNSNDDDEDDDTDTSTTSDGDSSDGYKEFIGEFSRGKTLQTFTIIIIIIIIIMQNYNIATFIILHCVYCNLVEYCNILYCGTLCELYYNLCECL